MTVGLNSGHTTGCLKSVHPTPRSHVMETGIPINTVFKVELVFDWHSLCLPQFNAISPLLLHNVKVNKIKLYL
jgi:hypothetical protein